MRPTRKTMPFQRRSSRETALLMHIRFSLLMLKVLTIFEVKSSSIVSNVFDVITQ